MTEPPSPLRPQVYEAGVVFIVPLAFQGRCFICVVPIQKLRLGGAAPAWVTLHTLCPRPFPGSAPSLDMVPTSSSHSLDSLFLLAPRPLLILEPLQDLSPTPALPPHLATPFWFTALIGDLPEPAWHTSCRPAHQLSPFIHLDPAFFTLPSLLWWSTPTPIPCPLTFSGLLLMPQSPP